MPLATDGSPIEAPRAERTPRGERQERGRRPPRNRGERGERQPRPFEAVAETDGKPGQPAQAADEPRAMPPLPSREEQPRQRRSRDRYGRDRPRALATEATVGARPGEGEAIEASSLPKPPCPEAGPARPAAVLQCGQALPPRPPANLKWSPKPSLPPAARSRGGPSLPLGTRNSSRPPPSSPVAAPMAVAPWPQRPIPSSGLPGRGLPKVRGLLVADLRSCAGTGRRLSGLQWVGFPTRQGPAACPGPPSLRAPARERVVRERPPLIVLDDGPLILVEPARTSAEPATAVRATSSNRHGPRAKPPAMLLLLSPAKSLDYDTPLAPCLRHTLPRSSPSSPRNCIEVRAASLPQQLSQTHGHQRQAGRTQRGALRSLQRALHRRQLAPGTAGVQTAMSTKACSARSLDTRIWTGTEAPGHLQRPVRVLRSARPDDSPIDWKWAPAWRRKHRAAKPVTILGQPQSAELPGTSGAGPPSLASERIHRQPGLRREYFKSVDLKHLKPPGGGVRSSQGFQERLLQDSSASMPKTLRAG
ncbi:hypothetical protein FQR65_LT20765 [Abscondita terminalis]|nr:hypothetical protein FQR65_LT20765 [Abscondita terminalis]